VIGAAASQGVAKYEGVAASEPHQLVAGQGVGESLVVGELVAQVQPLGRMAELPEGGEAVQFCPGGAEGI
jgi:hypothetical protein